MLPCNLGTIVLSTELAGIQLCLSFYTTDTRGLLQSLLDFYKALLRTQKLSGAIRSLMITNKEECLC